MLIRLEKACTREWCPASDASQLAAHRVPEAFEPACLRLLSCTCLFKRSFHSAQRNPLRRGRGDGGGVLHEGNEDTWDARRAPAVGSLWAMRIRTR